MKKPVFQDDTDNLKDIKTSSSEEISDAPDAAADADAAPNSNAAAKTAATPNSFITAASKRRIPKYSKKTRLILKIALALFVCIFALSLAYIIYTLYEESKQDQIIREEMPKISEIIDNRTPAPTPTPTPENSPDDDPGDTKPTESQWARELRLLLEAEAEGRILFAETLEINPDFLGVIEIPGVIERQPYVMSRNNNDYLYTDFYGNYNRQGTLFLNALNDHLLIDYNSVIFGHYTSTGNMFTKLMEYKKAATYKTSPIIVLDGLIGESVWIIFASHVVEPETWFMMPASNEAEFAGLIEEIRARSLFDTDVEVTAKDKIITLSTCDYTYDDMRFVVHARKLREGEEIPEEVIAQTNTDRKNYSIPYMQQLGSVNMNGAAFAIDPFYSRLVFFNPVSGAFDRYIGDRSNVQGPFKALSHSGISAGMYTAAALIDARADAAEGAQGAFITVSGLGGAKGISLFTAPNARATYTYRGTVTPEGVDAKFPALQIVGDKVWLYYSVSDGGDTLLYRQNTNGENRELVHTARTAGNVRVLGMYTVHNQPIIVWHEPDSGEINGARIGAEESFNLASADGETKITLYGNISGSAVNAVYEKGGRITFGTVDLDRTPTTPIETPEPSSTPDDPGETHSPGDPDGTTDPGGE
ncbi:MAG: class B sortase [Oscillospiraceae bacterium]|nr:class B sortase [Oscillospiraceae bacterium]